MLNIKSKKTSIVKSILYLLIIVSAFGFNYFILDVNSVYAACDPLACSSFHKWFYCAVGNVPTYFATTPMGATLPSGCIDPVDIAIENGCVYDADAIVYFDVPAQCPATCDPVACADANAPADLWRCAVGALHPTLITAGTCPAECPSKPDISNEICNTPTFPRDIRTVCGCPVACDSFGADGILGTSDDDGCSDDVSCTDITDCGIPPANRRVCRANQVILQKFSVACVGGKCEKNNVESVVKTCTGTQLPNPPEKRCSNTGSCGAEEKWVFDQCVEVTNDTMDEDGVIESADCSLDIGAYGIEDWVAIANSDCGCCQHQGDVCRGTQIWRDFGGNVCALDGSGNPTCVPGFCPDILAVDCGPADNIEINICSAGVACTININYPGKCLSLGGMQVPCDCLEGGVASCIGENSDTCHCDYPGEPTDPTAITTFCTVGDRAGGCEGPSVSTVCDGACTPDPDPDPDPDNCPEDLNCKPWPNDPHICFNNMQYRECEKCGVVTVESRCCTNSINCGPKSSCTGTGDQTQTCLDECGHSWVNSICCTEEANCGQYGECDSVYGVKQRGCITNCGTYFTETACCPNKFNCVFLEPVGSVQSIECTDNCGDSTIRNYCLVDFSNCSEWSECVNGQRSRTCPDACGATVTQTEVCSDCTAGLKTKICPNGTIIDSCDTCMSCTTKTCTNGTKVCTTDTCPECQTQFCQDGSVLCENDICPNCVCGINNKLCENGVIVDACDECNDCNTRMCPNGMSVCDTEICPNCTTQTCADGSVICSTDICPECISGTSSKTCDNGTVIDSCDTCSLCTTQTCPSGIVVCDTETCPPCTTQTCADGSKICQEDTCPTCVSGVSTKTCPNGTVVDSCDTCPPCTTQTCLNGVIVCDTETCPPCTTQTCADGSVICDTETCPTCIYGVSSQVCANGIVVDSCDTCSPCTTQTCSNGIKICSTETCPPCTTQTCADGSVICITDICPNIEPPVCGLGLVCYTGDCTCSNTQTQNCYCDGEPFSSEFLACSYTSTQVICDEWSTCSAQGQRTRDCFDECGTYIRTDTENCEPPVGCPEALVCYTGDCTCSNTQTQNCYCQAEPFSSEFLACTYTATDVCSDWSACTQDILGNWSRTRTCDNECIEPWIETEENCEPPVGCPEALVCYTDDCFCSLQTQNCYCQGEPFSSEFLACSYTPTETCTEWVCTEVSPGVFKETRTCDTECTEPQEEQGVTCNPECPLPPVCYKDDCCCLVQNEYCVDACTNELTVTPGVCNFTSNESCDWCACGYCYSTCNDSNQCEQIEGLGNDECVSGDDCYHNVCVNEQCIILDGPGDTDCYDNSDCVCLNNDCGNTTHNECVDEFCVIVNGPGIDQCTENIQCTQGTHKGCNVFGQCVDLFGPGEQDCPENCSESHTECTGTVRECTECKLEKCGYVGESICLSCYDECILDNACVLVDGPGNNECVLDNNDNTCKDYNVCTEEGQCIRIEGPGNNVICNEDSDCDCVGEDCDLHYECDIEGECVELPGPGSQTCDCFNVHTECNREKQCVVIATSGDDKCNSDTDCTSTHTECNSFDQCVVVDGIGSDQCSFDSDCSYYGCDTSSGGCSCALISGVKQDDECGDDLDCTTSPVCQLKNACDGLSCAPTPCQEGESCSDACYSDEDCCSGPDYYLACEDEKCICKPGNFEDECGSDDSCLFNSICIYEQCIPASIFDIIGLPGPECSVLNGNIDCEVINPPYATNLSVDSGSYCTGLYGAGVADFSWTYVDVDGEAQSGFTLQIDDSPDFSSPVLNWPVYGISFYETVNNQSVIVNNLPHSGSNLNYGTSYYWRVKVQKDNRNTESDWIYYDGALGTTDINSKIAFVYGYSHPAPVINIDFSNQDPIIDEVVSFIDRSSCYDNSVTYPCSILSSGRTWNFGDNSTSTLPNPNHSYTSANDFTVSLEVCDTYEDSNGITRTGCCSAQKDINVKNESSTELPKIKEIPPY